MHPNRAARLAVLVACLAAPAWAAEPPALARARVLYNAADYDGAIDAASAVRQMPPWADAATLVVARSRLERFRARRDPVDLAMARELLASVRAPGLTPRDHLDLLVGMGLALYLGDSFGPAADVLGTALTRAAMLQPADRAQLLDWWATAVDREAQARPADRRGEVYARLTERMEVELGADPGSRPANYWLVVAARGMGDPDRAWDAAVAAWVRSVLARGTAAALREDLDRLVTQAVITERARAWPAREQADAAASLRAAWDGVKQAWR